MNIPSAVARLADNAQKIDAKFSHHVLAGLSAHPKKLSPKYFYDAKGSDLFEEITQLPEYYPTRTEIGILRDSANDIAKLIPDDAALIEFGAGSTTKARLLLATGKFSAYVPVDISEEFLQDQANALQSDWPALTVRPVGADFTTDFKLPDIARKLPRVGFFPGSTIGNFEPVEACAFLKRARAMLGEGSLLIVGTDLEKDVALLQAAYNDSAGVTAAFNLNLLSRINAELGGSFNIDGFTHRAIYNRDRRRVEMHLVSRKAQSARVLGRGFDFRMGETIHTESSYKFTVDSFHAMARGAGFAPLETFTDPQNLFAVHVLVA